MLLYLWWNDEYNLLFYVLICMFWILTRDEMLGESLGGVGNEVELSNLQVIWQVNGVLFYPVILNNIFRVGIWEEWKFWYKKINFTT